MAKELGLNVLVGPGEAFELDRLLASLCVPGFFDEIVIVRTTHDPEVERVARQWTTITPYFEWVADFAAARNFALKHSTTDYVMWVDADDVCPPQSQERLLKLKEHVVKAQMDVYLIPYHLEFDEAGNMVQFLPRDRIFRRGAGLKWMKRVHEQLSVDTRKHSIVTIQGLCIEHRPTKQGNVGLKRNMEILADEYKKYPDDPHTAFYYSRDLFLMGKLAKAVKIFDRILQARMGNADNLVVAALQSAMYYTYRDERSLKKRTLALGENYARIAMSFSEKYAEPLVILGDIMYFRGQERDAERMFKLAMGKRLDGNGVQQVAFYEEIPADRLAHIYLERGELEQALYYNSLVLQHQPKDKRIQDRARLVMRELRKKYA